MQTLRQIVSEIATEVKALNLDDRLSFRFLANKFRGKISYFLRLEARSREFLKEMGIWRTIHCIDLEETPYTSCGYIDGCNTLKRSTKQIPEAYATNYGLLIKILTVDNAEFKLINAFDYKDYITREYNTNKNVYWFENRYVYVPNTDIERVKGMLLPKDPIEVDKLNCTVNQCASPLDSEITYSEYLVTLAKKEIINDLMGGNKRVVEDEKGDDNTNVKA